MPDVDDRLLAALLEQQRRRESALRRGARHVGWKLGMGRRERIGEHIAVGYLTTDTVIGPADRCAVAVGSDCHVHVDAELCVELGGDIDGDAPADAVRAAIACCWPALEIVDLAPRVGEPESIVVGNVFHRAVRFGDTPIPLVSDQLVSVYVNGKRRDRAPWPTDVPARIASAAALVNAVGERMRAGDRVITGSIIQVPIAAGDELRADFGKGASITITALAGGRRHPRRNRRVR